MSRTNGAPCLRVRTGQAAAQGKYTLRSAAGYQTNQERSLSRHPDKLSVATQSSNRLKHEGMTDFGKGSICS